MEKAKAEVAHGVTVRQIWTKQFPARLEHDRAVSAVVQSATLSSSSVVLEFPVSDYEDDDEEEHEKICAACADFS